MAVWIALFRGINVGGKNVLPMANLRETLKSAGLENVQTYIQSGNVVFESSARSAESLRQKLITVIEDRAGLSVDVIVFSKKHFLSAIEENPFPEATAEPKSLHFYFLGSAAKTADLTAIENAASKTERYHLTRRVFYLHAPDGIGRSKLAANTEKYLGVSATARNYRTVDRLRAMVTA